MPGDVFGSVDFMRCKKGKIMYQDNMKCNCCLKIVFILYFC
jgi:hypothetical protein